MNAVYIHMPFCKHICAYCDFCKVLLIDSFVDDYIESLQQEILDSYDGERIKSMYIGGGTPSCIPHHARVKLFRVLEIFNKEPNCEYTFECNPGDINEELLDDLVAGGVNRISIGVETFDPENLKMIERELDFKDLEEKLNLIRKRGINNINLDLMYALPGEKIQMVKKDLTKLLKLNPTHISTYSLILEDHTKFKCEGVEQISEDLDRKMYDYICNKLKKNGFKHYEVSNFALPGYESIHNLTYWNNQEYYGFGLGASGYKQAFRYTNTRNLHEYIKGNFRVDQSLMTYKDQMDNEIMLGLRKIEGINLSDFFDRYGKNLQEVYPIEELIQQGLLKYENGYLYIPEDKIYVMNEIIMKLI